MADPKEEASIEELLSPFVGDLWIKRRLELEQVLGHLAAAAPAQRDQEQVEEWTRFVKLLDTHCSGRQFTSDRQWSELMNHMQISRRLNHRSVKFRDILRNRAQIQANLRHIKRLNESARLVQVVEGLLSQWDSLMAAGHLARPEPKSTSFMLQELSSARDYLRDRCQPLLGALRVELQSDALRLEPMLEQWQQLADKHELSLRKLSDFLSRVARLQRKLLHLSHLMGATTSPSPNESASTSVSSTIDTCKAQFQSAYKFNEQLVESLVQRHPSFVRLISLSESKRYTDSIAEAQRTLDTCDSKLSQLIQDLRIEFGRFYFVSDHELLSIIGLDTKLVLSQDSASKRLLAKLFSNSFESYLLNEGDSSTQQQQQQLMGVQNALGERVYFQDGPIALKKRVKIYSLEIVRIFNETLRKLSTSLKVHLASCFPRLPEARAPSDSQLPVQVMLLRDQINFSSSLEEAARGRGSLESLGEFYELKLKELSGRHLREEQPNHLDRYKSSSAISLTIQFLSTVRRLQAAPAAGNARKRLLMRQLLYYFEAADGGGSGVGGVGPQVRVKIGTSTFDYGFEYLPLSQDDPAAPHSLKRLINTRTSELAFLVASAAVSDFRLGANPFGPAGSGKTETIKALGHLLGYQVVVHNCDETNDSDSLDRIISGLTQTGLWGCFDEFNRLGQGTLSAVSQRLEQVQGAIRAGKNTLETEEGQFMRINPASAFFVTLNPAAPELGYKGRRRLPANLRHLFLPVAMTQVEVDIIFGEKLLTSNAQLAVGPLEIDEARELGARMARWLEEMRLEEVGRGRCQWDLRLIMAILKRLERLLVRPTKEVGRNSSGAAVDWNGLLREAVQIELEPRLTGSEFNLLNSKLRSSRIDVRPTNDTGPRAIIESSTHLESQMDTHTGVLLVGPSTSGKSQAWRALRAKRAPAAATECLPLNPKSCRDLLGSVRDEKWADGLFTALVRKSHRLLLDEQSGVTQVWIVLDGPIDPDWIESLNSVLDDNQILTLGSGERLGFTVAPNRSIKLIFEAADVSLASPATVSRLGLVLFEQPNLPEAQLTSSSSLDDFLQSKGKLCCVTPSIPESYSGGGRLKWLEYHCSEHSTCEELQELVMEHASTNPVLLLSNVHLIKSDDKYGSRSFIELLRFMLTYDGYYDTEHNFRQLKSRFIVTLDDPCKLEPRCLSLAEVVCRFEHSTTTPRIISEDVFDAALGANAESVITLTGVAPHLNVQKELADRVPDLKLNSFSTRAEILESIQYLEELVSRPPMPRKEASVLILKSIECNLMTRDNKSRLFHLLNKFKMRFQGARFIYLNHGTSDLLNGFWSSIGAVLELDRKFATREQVKAYMKDQLVTMTKDAPKLSKDWIIDKAVSYMSSANEYDDTYVELLTRCIVAATNEAVANLVQKQRILSQGLSQLNNFGQSVELMRNKCKLQEEELTDRKCQVEKLMADVKESIETAHKQRDKMEQLERQHNQRTDDIRAKSSSIERDLKQVADMVEDSKVEVEKYLKPESLNEIKSLREPPRTIKDILDVLFLLLGVKDLSWISIKSNLAKGNLRDDLTRYDARRRLNASLLNRAQLMMAERKSSFSLDNAARASKAVVPIIGWIRATLEYGKMIVKLEPLTSEMDRLSHESAGIAEEAERLRSHLAELNSKIANDNSKLDELNERYKESLRCAERIRSQLSKAEETGQSLATQRASWETKLARTSSALGDEGLTKLCLASALLTVGPASRVRRIGATAADVKTDDELDRLLLHCELGGCNGGEELAATAARRVFAEKATNLFLSAECLNELALKDTEEVSASLSLLAVKLCLLINTVPFIDMGVSEAGAEADELEDMQLVKWLEMKQMLGQSVALQRMDATTSGSTCLQALELNIRLGRLTCLRLAANQLADLEVAHTILAETGRLAEHPELRALVRTIGWRNQQSSAEVGIQSVLLDCLVSFYDPALNQSIRRHEQELELKRAEVRQLEWRLLDRLAQRLPTAGGGAEADLVDILIELQLLSGKLATDVSRLSAGLAQLKSSQQQYQQVAGEAEKFYFEFVRPLGNIEAFYRLPLDRYCELVLKSLNVKQTSGSTKRLPEALDHSYLASRVARGMRVQDRQVFVGRLKESGLVDSSLSVGHLKELLMETLEEIQSGDPGKPRLMLVAHDSAESSPQLELDELVQAYNTPKRHQGVAVPLRYTKVYAGGDEAAGQRLRQTIELAIKTARASRRQEVEVVCVGNAHLAARWLNSGWLVSRLVDTRTDDCKVLILLIAEAASLGAAQGLDSTVLGGAGAKLWYDESGLSLAARFKLFTDRLLSAGGLSRAEPSIRRLVLLHVVCQERARVDQGGGWGRAKVSTTLWQRPYVFDYNQLRLAARSLHRLQAAHQDDAWRELFCHHLRDVIYGPRLETREDQEALGRLVSKFMDEHSPEPQRLVEELMESAQELAPYEACLSKLISAAH